MNTPSSDRLASAGSERRGGTPGRAAAALAAFCLVSAGTLHEVVAQSVDLERRSYARLEELRTDLLRLCTKAPAARRVAMAQAFVEEGTRHPFETLSAARAAVLGVEDDDLLRYRTGTMALVLPEVVDQDRYHVVHVTAHAPRIVPDLPGVRFEAWIEDLEGERIRELSITEKTALQDVMRVRATGSMPTGGLREAAHVVAMETWIGDEGPRPQDPSVRAEVVILPGFAERAERLPLRNPATPEARAAAQARLAEIPAERRGVELLAVLAGATSRVERIYAGRPRIPGAGPLAALAVAERVLDNLIGGRGPLDGLEGPVTIGLPATGKGGNRTVLNAALDVPAADRREQPRPLVIFVPGAPVWDARSTRPHAPEATDPEWLRERLRLVGFDREGEFQSVVLESPGRVTHTGESLADATTLLQRLLPWTAGQPVVWIGERESCYAVQRGVQDPPETLKGAVFVAGPGPTAADVDALEGIALLAVPAQGHASTGFLDYVVRAVGDEERYRSTDPTGIAWPLAIPLRAAAIESFVRSVTGR